MNDRLTFMHDHGVAEKSLSRIRSLLVELYGEDQGVRHYVYLKEGLDRYLASQTTEDLQEQARFNPRDPYAHLDGKIFAICYPDNIYNHISPTLKTLEETLEKHFPAIKGIHILPERMMSHFDIWPQDLLHLIKAETAIRLVSLLQQEGILDQKRRVAESFGVRKEQVERDILPAWYALNESEIQAGCASFVDSVIQLLENAFNSHFNDGGFSQKTRARVDPRFGGADDIRRLSQKYAVMLDYVVNHLDFENPILDAYRRGEGDGSAFLIISPEKYEELKRDGTIEKTFRPRPFPLFTGMRKQPSGDGGIPRGVIRMNHRFQDGGLEPLDSRLIAFLAIAFKVKNDQGLSAQDRRVFLEFMDYLRECDIDTDSLFTDSAVQPQQKVLIGQVRENIIELLEALEHARAYADIFSTNDDEIFGEKFFVYTTFSESQVDVYPQSEAGFRMVVDDLFHLLDSGRLAMMRMDAIKYLWKEIGARNFDLQEGNKLIEVIRLLMHLAAPRVLPLDEINSPDPVVYEMNKTGGFAYIFGQINAVPVAFNSANLKPIRHFYDTMRERCPENLVLFGMLSTHDGRSVQGIGVQRTDGHVSIADFYDLKKVVQERGGKPKYRSVPKGRIPADTLRKACTEAGIGFQDISRLFAVDPAPGQDFLLLKGYPTSRSVLLETLAKAASRDPKGLADIPAIDYILEWMIDGTTPYELCCTTRSAFQVVGSQGRPISPEEEAARLALAHLAVLTLGQMVPAIYFNDLLGLENDAEGFQFSGKPRDLNRHKSYLPEVGLDDPSKRFTAAFITLINRILDARATDAAFCPGSREFELRVLSDTVFLNHPFARKHHSFILGNIGDAAQSVSLKIPELEGVTAENLKRYRDKGLLDALSDQTYFLDETDRVTLSLPAYGAVWVK